VWVVVTFLATKVVSALTSHIAMKTSKKSAWPLVKKTRYGKVTIYHQTREDRESFILAYRLGKKRVRETTNMAEEALERAAVILSAMEKGQTPEPRIKSVSKWKHLIGDVPIEEVFRVYAEQNNLLPSVTVETVVQEFLLVKSQDGLKPDTYATIKNHLGKLTERYGSSYIKNITPDDLNTFLRGIKSLRYRHNHRTTIKSFFKWALSKNYVRYMPQYGGTVADGTQAISSKHFQKTPDIYSPEELKRLFDEAHWSMVPWLIAANYSGIRKAEIARLKWEDVDWDESAFVLKTEITKTSNRRMAYFPPGVKEGLKKIAEECKRRKIDKIIYGNINKRVAKLRVDAEIPWRQNGHRKAYISYAMALTRDAAEVAEQCGNSAQEIQRTYKGLTSKTIAEQWFKVIDTPGIEAKLY
jgi:integrase